MWSCKDFSHHVTFSALIPSLTSSTSADSGPSETFISVVTTVEDGVVVVVVVKASVVEVEVVVE